MSLRIQQVSTPNLPAALRDAILALCEAAYEEPMAGYLADIGPGEHLLGFEEERLVSHLMWVERRLEVAAGPALRTAYIELVATHPTAQGRGHATALLAELPPRIAAYDLGALSPATEGLYFRAGWEYWRGPLFHRRNGQFVPDSEERVMVLRLPRSPALDLDAALSVDWRPGEVW